MIASQRLVPPDHPCLLPLQEWKQLRPDHRAGTTRKTRMLIFDAMVPDIASIVTTNDNPAFHVW